MIAILRRGRVADGGFTLMELSVAGFLSSIVLGAVVLIFNSVGQGATDAGRRADLQVQVREVATEMAAELRSAVAPRAGATAIESLTPGSLVFFADRYDFPGPERIVYEATACAGGYCQLRARRYAADASSGPNWTYPTVPFNDVVLLERIVEDVHLFAGEVWSGSVRTTVTSCGSGSRCTFPIVAIDLQAAAPDVSTIEGPFGVFLEVSLRNA